MSLLSEYAKSKVVLRKQSGGDHRALARFESATKMLVPNTTFPAEAGDVVFHELPSGAVQTFTIVHVHYEPGLDEDTAHYVITLENVDRRSAPSSPPATHITNNYTIGQAAAVGHGATAVENTLVQHNTAQTLNVDYAGLAGDLAKIRKALNDAAENDDDLDAAEEAGKVARAQKLIKENDHGRLLDALKSFGSKVWNTAQGLALTYMDYKLRQQLGLPPGDP